MPFTKPHSAEDHCVGKDRGQTISTSVKAAVLTAAEQATERTCIQNLITKTVGPHHHDIPVRVPRGGGGFGGGGGGFRFAPVRAPRLPNASRPPKRPTSRTWSFPSKLSTKSLNPADHQHQHLDYTVAGVTPPIRPRDWLPRPSLVKGAWLQSTPSVAKSRCCTTAYASQKGLKVGDTLTITKSATGSWDW